VEMDRREQFISTAPRLQIQHRYIHHQGAVH
jgi:hypothetical protein